SSSSVISSGESPSIPSRWRWGKEGEAIPAAIKAGTIRCGRRHRKVIGAGVVSPVSRASAGGLDAFADCPTIHRHSRGSAGLSGERNEVVRLSFIVMAGLVPAIHALSTEEKRRGCPAQGRA